MSTAGQADPRRPALVLLHGFALHSGPGATGPPACNRGRAASDRSARPEHALGPAHHGSAGLARDSSRSPGAIVPRMVAWRNDRASTRSGATDDHRRSGPGCNDAAFRLDPGLAHGIEPEVLETFAQNVRAATITAPCRTSCAPGAGRCDPRVTRRAQGRCAVARRPTPTGARNLSRHPPQGGPARARRHRAATLRDHRPARSLHAPGCGRVSCLVAAPGRWLAIPGPDTRRFCRTRRPCGTR